MAEAGGSIGWCGDASARALHLLFAVSRLKKLLVFRSAELPPRALAVWDSDPRCEALCCEFAFSLYELGSKGTLVTLGENGYRCDV
jgi:hypothetical protein